MADTTRQAHSRQDLDARPKTKGWTQQGGTQGGHMADKFWGRGQSGHKAGHKADTGHADKFWGRGQSGLKRWTQADPWRTSSRDVARA